MLISHLNLRAPWTNAFTASKDVASFIDVIRDGDDDASIAREGSAGGEIYYPISKLMSFDFLTLTLATCLIQKSLELLFILIVF